MNLNINSANFSNTNNSIKTTKPNCTDDLNNNTKTLTESKNPNSENTSSNTILSINDIPYTLPINTKEQKLQEINKNKFQKRILKEFILYCNQNHLDKNDNSILSKFLENKNIQLENFLQNQLEEMPEQVKIQLSIDELSKKTFNTFYKIKKNIHIINLNDQLSAVLNSQEPNIDFFFLKNLQAIFPEELPKDLRYHNTKLYKKFIDKDQNSKLITDEIESENLRTKNYLKQIQSKLNELSSKATIENKSYSEELAKNVSIAEAYEKKLTVLNIPIDTNTLTLLNKPEQYKKIIDFDNIKSLYMNIIKESNVDTYINNLQSKNKEIKKELKEDQESLNLKLKQLLEQLQKEPDETNTFSQRHKIFNEYYSLRTFINSSNALILDYQTQYQELQEKCIKDYSNESVTKPPILDIDEDKQLPDLISSKQLTRKDLYKKRSDLFKEKNDNLRVFTEYYFDAVLDENGNIDPSKTLLKSKLNPEGTIINISKDFMNSLFKQKDDGTIDLSFKQNLYADCYLLSSIDYIFNNPELFIEFLEKLEEEDNKDGSKNLIINFNLYSNKDLLMEKSNYIPSTEADHEKIFKVKIPFKKDENNQYRPKFKFIEEDNRAKSESIIVNVIEEAYTIKRLDACLSDFDNAINFIQKTFSSNDFNLPYSDISALRKELQKIQSGSGDFNSIKTELYKNIKYLCKYINNLGIQPYIPTANNIYNNIYNNNNNNNLALQTITHSDTSNILSAGSVITCINSLIPNLQTDNLEFYDNNFPALSAHKINTVDKTVLEENFLYSIFSAITHNFRTNNQYQFIIPVHQYNIDGEFNDSVFLVNPHNNKTVFETTKKVIDLF